MEYVVPIIVAVIVVFLLSNICIVPQATEYVIEFLGKYRGTWSGNSF